MNIRPLAALSVLVLLSVPAAADDITNAIDQARKAYSAGDLSGAKQSLDLASQLIGQKNAEGFAALLPNPLPGWTAEKAQTTAVGASGFTASVAHRSYRNAKGDQVEVQITGDSALVTQYATVLANPAIAGAVGKVIVIGGQRAIQTADGDVQMVVGSKFLVTVQGSGDAATKGRYAQAVDIAKLSKM